MSTHNTHTHTYTHTHTHTHTPSIITLALRAPRINKCCTTDISLQNSQFKTLGVFAVAWLPRLVGGDDRARPGLRGGGRGINTKQRVVRRAVGILRNLKSHKKPHISQLSLLDLRTRQVHWLVALLPGQRSSEGQPAYIE